MPELYETHAMRVQLVERAMADGQTAETIVDILDYYHSQFLYKCKDPWCPSADKQRPNINGHRYVGFPSQQALNQHRLIDHHKHGLSHITYNVLNYPWYICQCGHYSHLNDEEKELYDEGKWNGDPQERLDHLSKVQ